MEFLFILLAAGCIFGLCYIVDKAFTKAFRSKAQHRSGLAVRASKRYGLFGVILIVLGILGICTGVSEGAVLWVGGIIVMLMGAGLAVHYLSYGIFYDKDSFLLSRFGNKDRVYQFGEIQGQKLYLIQGGAVMIELYMKDGSSVSVQSVMEGVYPFLDAAFVGWCAQTGRDPEQCPFHDPSQSLWFPTVEEG